MKKNKFRLCGGLALVTGASSGIGKEMSKILIERYRMTVIGVGRSGEKLLRVKEELSAQNQAWGDCFIPLPFDVSLRTNWTAAQDLLTARGEKLSLFVSNAGILPPFFAEAARPDAPATMENALQTNLLASVYGTEALRPFMAKNAGAVYIASSAALCTMPGIAAYASSKSALKAYAETLAAEKSFAYVGLVFPGFTKTDVMRRQTAKTGKLIDKISMPADKMARKTVRAIQKRKRRKILGADAKGMHLLYALFPRSAPKIIGWVLKKSGYAMFDNVFDRKTTVQKEKRGRDEKPTE